MYLNQREFVMQKCTMFFVFNFTLMTGEVEEKCAPEPPKPLRIVGIASHKMTVTVLIGLRLVAE